MLILNNMNFDFLDQLIISQAAIPPVVMRIAGFFLVVQALLIVLQKKNDPHKAIWEDIQGVLLAGIVVFLFPEFIKFAELLVNSTAQIKANPQSMVADLMKTSFFGEETAEEESSGGNISSMVGMASAFMNGGVTNVGSYMFANNILKPLADIVNVLCFPTFMFIRAASLKIAYFVAPLVLMLGAFEPFRALWKHWFMIYFALLFAGPALVLANNFCEDCFTVYINMTDSPILGFLMIAMARFKIFQAVLDLCYRFFRV